MAKSKPVIFKLYMDMMEHTDDPFWKDQLKMCAINKRIKHVTVHASSITVYDPKNRKGTSVHLTNDPAEAFHIFKKTLRDSLGMYSMIDMKNQEEAFSRGHTAVTDNVEQWRKISFQRTKDDLLINYCIDFAKKHNQSKAKRTMHFNLLNHGLLFKIIKNTDVIMEKSRIKHIEGVAIDTETKQCYIEQSLRTSEKSITWNEKGTKTINDELKNYIKSRHKYL